MFVSPAVAGSDVYVGSCSGSFFAFELDTGRVRWSYDTSRDVEHGQFHGEALVTEMQDFVKSQISAFKYPRAIEFVDELPHTPTGKIQRGALRQLERERAGG